MMIHAMKALLPSPAKKALGKIASMLRRRGDKYDWEFEWQRTEWLPLWKQSDVQMKCLEYWVRFRHFDDIKQFIQPTDQTRIMDVGCGLSSVLHFLPGVRLGIDPLGDRYKSVYEYPFEVRRGLGEDLPVATGAFDVAFSSNCIDHTTDPDRVLREVKRALKPNGYLILTCEVFDEDLGERNPGHPHSMTSGSLRQLVSRHFSVVAEWNEPWYGLRGYCLGQPPTAQREYIYTLQKT
jgi:SAM-dependent methyltransferase